MHRCAKVFPAGCLCVMLLLCCDAPCFPDPRCASHAFMLAATYRQCGMQMLMGQVPMIPQLITDHPTARQGLRGSLGLPPFSRGAEPPPLQPLTLIAPLQWGQSPLGLLPQVQPALCSSH